MSALIEEYVAGLRRRLPRPIAEEASAGLIEAYEHHLASGEQHSAPDAGDREAARHAIAEFGDIETVIGAFTRQAPGRQAARVLLATGPVAAACWAGALVLGRAWTWPTPGAARLAFGAILLLAALLLAVAATSRHGYRRTRLALLAGPAIVVLDAAAVAWAVLVAPAITPVLAAAVAVSLARIALTARLLLRLVAR